MNNIFFEVIALISLTVTEASSELECLSFRAGFREALEDATGTNCDNIKEEDLEKLTELDLQGLNLLDFNDEEEEVFEHLFDLEFLDLSGNGLSYLPEGIGDMENLEELNISGNFIDRFSILDLKNFQDLEILNLSGNGLSYLPEGIRDMENLTEIDITGNSIDSYDILNNLDLEQTNVIQSITGEKNLYGDLISPDDFYRTGTGAEWVDCFFFPCWKNHAYIETGDSYLLFAWCAGDDPGDECEVISRGWYEELKNGNQLLVTTYPYRRNKGLISVSSVTDGPPQPSFIFATLPARIKRVRHIKGVRVIVKEARKISSSLEALPSD